MNIIIAGDGEVGFHLAKLLSSENHNITVIDPKTDFIKLVENENNILAVSGDPTSISVLKDNNVRKTDLFISVVHDEKTNIITTMLAKQLGAKTTIARISNPEYLETENREYFKKIGIDHLVCPERIAAEEILFLLNESGAIEYFEFSHSKLALMLIKIPLNSNFASKKIDDIFVEHSELAFRFVAIHRKSQTVVPKKGELILAGDYVYVIVKVEQVDGLLDVAGIKKFPIKNVMIIGGGRIGAKTALRLENKMNVKLIEIDKSRGRRLSNILQNTLIIHGDAKDMHLLEQEDLSQMDAFVAVTENSETNILTSLIAKQYGVKRVITLIDPIEYIDVAQNIGLESTINKKLITASHIAQFTMRANVASMKCLNGVDAEVMEFVAKAKSIATKKPIKNIGLPEGAIIGGIVRNNEGFIASADFQINENDNVVVFALPSAYSKIQRLFN